MNALGRDIDRASYPARTCTRAERLEALRERNLAAGEYCRFPETDGKIYRILRIEDGYLLLDGFDAKASPFRAISVSPPQHV